jgi:BirA family transcriptional regulator, biotin operon repressor / biotin---[acetyl-CoA-carboxylase] ligase
VYEEVGSTLDVAHAAAGEGAPAGTLILADSQTAGRGRSGRTWTSEKGAGIWLTVIERPTDTDALEVLSLRVGLALAPALDVYSDDTVLLKWPNDLYIADRKLGGILSEARWRDGTPEWVAIGVGINVRAPTDEPRASGLRSSVRRIDVLVDVVGAIRGAAMRTGLLTDAEIRDFAVRDLAVGRVCRSPTPGVVQGIDRRGSLLVGVASQTVEVRTGSLVFAEEL